MWMWSVYVPLTGNDLPLKGRDFMVVGHVKRALVSPGAWSRVVTPKNEGHGCQTGTPLIWTTWGWWIWGHDKTYSNKHMQKHSKHQVEMPSLYPGLAREAVERRQQRLSMGIQVGMARKLVSHWWVRIDIHTYIHACMHTYIHTFIHSYIHT